MLKRKILWTTAIGCMTLVACQSVPKTAPSDNTLSTIPQAELRDVLTELSNAHHQKQELALLMTIPILGAESPFREFFSTMSTQQRELADQLHAWAESHHMDLTYHYGTDTLGQAVKIMEARQGKLLQSDGRADRTRNALIQMYTDYDFRVSLLQALLPNVRDPALKAYVEKSLKIHEDGCTQLMTLLKRYKPS